MAATIRGTVGVGASNAPADVRVVQRLLAGRVAELDLPELHASGACDDATIRAIRAYQIRIAGDLRGSGRLAPGDRSFAMLADDAPGSLRREAVRARRARTQLSGGAWLAAQGQRFQDSRDVSALGAAFAGRLSAFLRALERGGAVALIEATRRDARRAWLIATAAGIARNSISPREAGSDPEVGIIWNHGDDQASRAAAEEMVELFGTTDAPAPGTPQLLGLAVAMRVRWFEPVEIVDAHGATVRLDRPREGAANPALHRVARSYGVVKSLTDPLLWLSASG